MYEYKIGFFIKTEKRSILIDVFSRLRDRTWISAKRDRAILRTIVNDNIDIEIIEIEKREV